MNELQKSVLVNLRPNTAVVVLGIFMHAHIWDCYSRFFAELPRFGWSSKINLHYFYRSVAIPLTQVTASEY